LAKIQLNIIERFTYNINK